MSSRRFVLQWAAAGWLSCVAFVVLPPVLRPMAGSAPDLPTRARDALIEQWESGVVDPVPSMADLVAQWADYHLLKSAFAFLVVVALARVLGLLGREHPLLVGVIAVAATVAWLVVFANVQGALAPLASVVSLLPPVSTDARYAAALSGLRADLASGVANPVTSALVEDFRFFHVVMVALAIASAVALGLAARRAARTGHLRSTAHTGAAVLLVVVLLVIGAANLSTALDPIPGLLGALPSPMP